MRSPVSRNHRAALAAVRLCFLANGILFAAWASRLPAIKERIGADEGQLAVVFVALNVGAVAGLRLGGRVTQRIGSRRTARITMPALCLALAAIPLVHTPWQLAVVMAIFGLINSGLDVAVNAHGLEVEQQLGHPVLSGVHARFSLGTIAGSVIGSIWEYAGVSLTIGLVATTAGLLPLVVIGTRGLLPTAAGPGTVSGGRRHHGWRPRLVLIGGLAFCVALGEGAANDWTAVYLHAHAGAGTTVAALGFGAFAGAMAAGRLAGDRLVAAYGVVTPFRVGTVVAAVGLGAALLWGGQVAGVLGFVAFGVGISFTLPVAIAAGSRVRGLDQATAVANVSTLGYAGFFTGPPLIGLLAEAGGLRVALALPAVLMLVAAWGAPVLDRREPGSNARRRPARGNDPARAEPRSGGRG